MAAYPRSAQPPTLRSDFRNAERLESRRNLTQYWQSTSKRTPKNLERSLDIRANAGENFATHRPCHRFSAPHGDASAACCRLQNFEHFRCC